MDGEEGKGILGKGDCPSKGTEERIHAAWPLDLLNWKEWVEPACAGGCGWMADGQGVEHFLQLGFQGVGWVRR